MTTKEYPCFLGHYFLKDPNTPILTNMETGIEHIKTICQRCGKIQVLHINPSKAVIK